MFESLKFLTLLEIHRMFEYYLHLSLNCYKGRIFLL